MNNTKVSHSMRIEKELLEKFKRVAWHDGRSANRDLLHYIRIKVKAFEDVHGEIINDEG